MPFYVKVGKVPLKRHTTFYKDDGKSLYREELFSTKGFSSIYSNKYHIYMPTKVEKIDEIKQRKLNEWPNALLQYYHFFTDNKKNDGNFITSRNEFLKNDNCVISTAHPTEDTDIFFGTVMLMNYFLFIKVAENFYLSMVFYLSGNGII
jgi:homogentisate 1,2-dioxygenase